MADSVQYHRLDGGGTTLVFALEVGGAADLVWCGASLPESEDPGCLAHATRRGRHESQPDVPPLPGICPERKAGWSGSPAVVIYRGDRLVESDFRVAGCDLSGGVLAIRLVDAVSGCELEAMWALGDDGVISTAMRITNTSSDELTIGRLSSLALPVPRRFTGMTSFAGRWAGEMRETSRPIAPEGFARASNIGKQGFGGGNWLLLHDPQTGEVMGAHLEWSGDYDTRLECDGQGAGDGRAMLQMGARLDPGEVTLGPGECFETPGAILAIALDRSALAQRFHRHLRSCIIGFDPQSAPRKVHLNTWEALGFDLGNEQLKRLADDAAALGVERFVLDDGWFGAKGKWRRDDSSSLGDWHVAPHLDLEGVIAHVHSLGMDFGLWVEPEMISPDSDLYRAHPDWCLHLDSGERATMRGQLVLDLTRREVCAYLAERLGGLLRTYDIAYLKWDHNRDLFPLAGRGHAQTQALYGLLRDLRAAFPQVEIESCSSGGGRIDTGILSYTDRVWPSDNNDSVERVRIMRAWSQFLPLEVLGNHVGPSPNPITGRRTDMDFRAKVALFGHMGVEADPGAMSEEERAVLGAHIALFKDWREVLHTGDWHGLDHPCETIFAQMVVGENKALAVAAQTAFSPEFDAAPLRLAGLDPDARYRVTLPLPWPSKAARYLPNKRTWRDGFELSGRALMTQGLALPITHPETAWLVALERTP